MISTYRIDASPWLPDLLALYEIAVARERGEVTLERSRLADSAFNRLLDLSQSPIFPGTLAHDSIAETDRVIASGLVYASILREATLGSDWIDSFGSATLSGFVADAELTASKREKFDDHLESTFKIPRVEMNTIRESVAFRAQDGIRKSNLIRAIREEYKIGRPLDDGFRAAVNQLFEDLFPAFRGLAPKAEIVATQALLFICLPIAGDDELTRRFCARASAHASRRLANYPSFGFLSLEDVSPDLAARLAERLGISADEAALELTRTVSFLPTEDLERYLVHDLWGHSWQATLLDFENYYQGAARCADRIPLAGPLREIFDVENGHFVLSTDAFARWFDREMEIRVPLAAALAVAEAMADLFEHKLIASRAKEARSLPNSSLFRSAPVKPDLGLLDITYCLGRTVAGLDLWLQEEEKTTLMGELREAGASPEDARSCVESLAALWSKTRAARIQPGGIPNGEWACLALGLLTTLRGVSRACEALDDKVPRRLPITGFRDAIAVCVAHFFEADPGRNFWRIEEFCTERLLPALLEL